MKNIDFSNSGPGASTSEAFGAMFGIPPAKDRIQEIPIEKLIPYEPPHESQPFKPYSEDKLREMAENIAENGVLEPIIVRPYVGKYQILAGHNRTNAAKLAGFSNVPCVIRENCDDDTAALIFVGTNLNQREELQPSEKGAAYKMQLEAMKRRAGRPSENSAQVGRNFSGKESREILAEQTGESRNQISRYIRFTYLIKPLLDMVDEKCLPFISAVNISYLKDNEQSILHEYIKMSNITVSVEQSKLLKMLSEDGDIGYSTMDNVFGKIPAGDMQKPMKTKAFKVKADKFARYIEPEMSERDFETYLLEAVEFYESHKGQSLRVVAKGEQHEHYG